MDWIDLPLSKRPQLILGMFRRPGTSACLSFILAYEPSLDQAGHATGPYSQRVNVFQSVHLTSRLLLIPAYRIR
jgi:hypothetical protein